MVFQWISKNTLVLHSICPKKFGCVQKKENHHCVYTKNNHGIQNHGITMVDVQKTWFYHGTCSKTWYDHSTVDVVYFQKNMI